MPKLCYFEFFPMRLKRHPQSGTPEPDSRPQRRIAKPKVGLVLGSGGARGVVHIPIIEDLAASGIPVDIIAASSIGAVMAGVYAAGALTALKEDLAAMKRDAVLKLFDPALSRSGLFAGRKAMVFLNRYIPRQTRIEDLAVPLGIVATDYDTGLPVVFKRGNLLDAIRASISIPGIFTPARLGKALLIDGGVANPLPIDVVKEMGADLTIAVNLHPAIGKLGWIPLKGPFLGKQTRGSALKTMSPLENLIRRLLDNGGWGSEGRPKPADSRQASQKAESEAQRKRPNLFEIIARTIDIMEYRNTLLMLETNPPTVLIDFNFPEISTLDFTMSPFLLKEGQKKAALKRPELIEKIKSAIAA